MSDLRRRRSGAFAVAAAKAGQADQPKQAEPSPVGTSVRRVGSVVAANSVRTGSRSDVTVRAVVRGAGSGRAVGGHARSGRARSGRARSVSAVRARARRAVRSGARSAVGAGAGRTIGAVRARGAIGRGAGSGRAVSRRAGSGRARPGRARAGHAMGRRVGEGRKRHDERDTGYHQEKQRYFFHLIRPSLRLIFAWRA